MDLAGLDGDNVPGCLDPMHNAHRAYAPQPLESYQVLDGLNLKEGLIFLYPEVKNTYRCRLRERGRGAGSPGQWRG